MVAHGRLYALLQVKNKNKGRRVRNPNDVVFKGSMDHMGGNKVNFYGNKYTWDNGKVGSQMIKEGLDKAICNNMWRIDFPRAIFTHIPCSSLDHLTILLYLYLDKDFRPCLFRVITTWFGHPNFRVVILNHGIITIRVLMLSNLPRSNRELVI